MKPEMLSNSTQINSDKECYTLVEVRMHLASFAAGTHPSICWQGIPFNCPNLPTKKASEKQGSTANSGTSVTLSCFLKSSSSPS